MTSIELPKEYTKLMTEMVECVRREDNFSEDNFAIFWPHVGNRYTDTDASIKLMVIGRAPNGTNLPPIPNNDSFEEMFRKHRSDGHPTSDDQNWVQWLEKANKVRGTAFWRLARESLLALNPETDASKWWTYITWTNLYKVAPKESGNPDDWLKKAQRNENLVQQILRQEIDTLDPDVVLCITGHTWMHEFWDKPRNNPLGVNWSDEYDWNGSIHKMTREPRESDKGERLWMVVRRPEFQKNEVAITPIANVLSRWREDPTKVFDQNGNW